jgi:two-component system LytT family response regulator
LPTSSWRVLIADDEPAARRGVRQLLAPFPEFAVAGECRDGAGVLAALDACTPDVLFLDVQMPGLDGFDVIRRRTPERMPSIVFLTAHEQFAIQAFEAQALDYLLKPVSEARFAATIKRLRRELRHARASAPAPAITIATGRGAIVVPLREIDWIESADNYARIWTGGRSYLVRESMQALESRVRAHGFVRAHRRALVSVEAVRELGVDPDGESVAILSGGARVPVSRRRRADVAQAIGARR